MIKYDILQFETHSERYLESLKDTYELVIDPNRFSYLNKYNVIQHPKNVGSVYEKVLFYFNDRYELKIWLDLNGFKIQNFKIFYNEDKQIEYASTILRKNE